MSDVVKVGRVSTTSFAQSVLAVGFIKLDIPDWPSGLPTKPLLSSMDETFAQNSITSQITTSLAKKRRRSTANVGKYTAEFFLDGDQLTIFKNFYNGATKFRLEDPRTGELHIFRFANNEPKFKVLSHNHYKVSIELEKLK